jgi:hypothetical protein
MLRDIDVVGLRTRPATLFSVWPCLVVRVSRRVGGSTDPDGPILVIAADLRWSAGCEGLCSITRRITGSWSSLGYCFGMKIILPGKEVSSEPRAIQRGGSRLRLA